ncbi:hypothetical protein [Rhodobacter capsulatus]|jgi:hypothetical protein|uniref:hypothetical protein n=1 Tax=Rhodobacter capsulatus TaxID=1061 RepID=UPI0011D17881|nr:hypothetical protein [Rhodobacter capsulatus]
MFIKSIVICEMSRSAARMPFQRRGPNGRKNLSRGGGEGEFFFGPAKQGAAARLAGPAGEEKSRQGGKNGALDLRLRGNWT